MDGLAARVLALEQRESTHQKAQLDMMEMFNSIKLELQAVQRLVSEFEEYADLGKSPESSFRSHVKIDASSLELQAQERAEEFSQLRADVQASLGLRTRESSEELSKFRGDVQQLIVESSATAQAALKPYIDGAVQGIAVQMLALEQNFSARLSSFSKACCEHVTTDCATTECTASSPRSSSGKDSQEALKTYVDGAVQGIAMQVRAVERSFSARLDSVTSACGQPQLATDCAATECATTECTATGHGGLEVHSRRFLSSSPRRRSPSASPRSTSVTNLVPELEVDVAYTPTVSGSDKPTIVGTVDSVGPTSSYIGTPTMSANRQLGGGSNCDPEARSCTVTSLQKWFSLHETGPSESGSREDAPRAMAPHGTGSQDLSPRAGGSARVLHGCSSKFTIGVGAAVREESGHARPSLVMQQPPSVLVQCLASPQLRGVRSLSPVHGSPMGRSGSVAYIAMHTGSATSTAGSVASPDASPVCSMGSVLVSGSGVLRQCTPLRPIGHCSPPPSNRQHLGLGQSTTALHQVLQPSTSRASSMGVLQLPIPPSASVPRLQKSLESLRAQTTGETSPVRSPSPFRSWNMRSPIKSFALGSGAS